MLTHVPEEFRSALVEDRLTLLAGVSTDEFSLVADLTRNDWLNNRLHAFVKPIHNFTHGINVGWHRGATTIVGIKPETRDPERTHREIARYVSKKPSHWQVVTVSIPKLLKMMAFHSAQQIKHGLDIIPTIFLKLPVELVEDLGFKRNFYTYPKQVHGFEFWYVDLENTHLQVSELRVRKKRDRMRGANPRNFFKNMDTVRKYNADICEVGLNENEGANHQCPVNGGLLHLFLVLALQSLLTSACCAAPSKLS
ncbi:hypothetical protein CYMTET_23699 [Cymbomonas tetramitiformis]|uniref:Uncharacterized protein n=1 Tax=Cymbomonas tetramitiformis TaxID=36881 RepID=A0AAE0FX95_9CHLO|nr:hypothetical protein CYMTET_23699 [Cymbomonas tetramitiformis]